MKNLSTPIQIAQRTDFPRIAELFVQQTQARRFRCLHSYHETVEGALQTMNQWADEDSISVVFATDLSNNVVGAFGAEYDAEIQRVWLWGPAAVSGATEPAAWLSLSGCMYNELLKTLPFAPKILDAFIDQPFEIGAQFYLDQGHHLAKTIYVLEASRPEQLNPPDDLVFRLSPDHNESFVPLFEETFPDTYYTGAQVAERQGDVEKTFVYLTDEVVQGFCHAKLNESGEEGYIEYVGVHQQARRQGIARRLLKTALYWLFTAHDVPRVGLTTGDDNVNAQALYFQAGFEMESVGLAYRRES